MLALQQAIRIEEEGQRFYLEAARMTTDTQGQRMFRTLADDEKLHLDMVRRQYQSLSRGGQWLALPEVKVSPIDLKAPLFPKGHEAVERAVRGDATELDALRFALDIENRSYDLYRQAAAETQDERGRAMYQFLAGAEREHFNTLMQRYELLTGRY